MLLITLTTHTLGCEIVRGDLVLHTNNHHKTYPRKEFRMSIRFLGVPLDAPVEEFVPFTWPFGEPFE